MDLAVQDRCKSGHRSGVAHSLAHAESKLGDSGIHHASEGRRALDDNDGTSLRHSLLHLVGEHNISVFSVLYRRFALCGRCRRIRRRRFLVHCGEHVDKVHPRLDIKADIR